MNNKPITNKIDEQLFLNNASNYFIKAILLEDCYYSISTYNLIKEHKIPSHIIYVNNNTKDTFKSNTINTFPQIYLNKYNTKGNLLLGGHNDLMQFIDNFKNKSIDKFKINKFSCKYKWSNQATLKLIKLINLKQ